ETSAYEGSSESEGICDAPEWQQLPLRRLVFDAAVPLPALSARTFAPEPGADPEFEWASPAAAQVGTLIHRELQALTEYLAEQARQRERATPGEVLPQRNPGRYRRELALLGVEPADLDDAAARVDEALQKVWQDPTGRWILQPRAEAWSELELSIRRSDYFEHLRLDRTFVEDGQRWIIDYKTGRHLGSDVDAFLDAEVERYREQLEAYAAAVAQFDGRPIRVALYFPLMSALREWQPEIGR
ncbi:MAG: PD-(D/E)XK nuclease family protein, partial [Gammaproteobacteria bacterium]|nr:PD-(D/E)XK nuclease family protein [Gammaproteobacteria bacterium]